MSYTDGYVLAVPKKNLATYKKMASGAGKVWIEHGALSYTESVADDTAIAKKYKMVDFESLAGAKKGEVVIFAYVTYKSRAHRDKVNAAVMAAMHDKCDPANMPFDFSRMAYGGFEDIVHYSADSKKPVAKLKAKAKPVKIPAKKK